MQGLRCCSRVGLALVGLAVVLGPLGFYRLKDQQARAVQQAAIFSKVSGYIRRVPADRGDFVKEGQLLAEIDDQELQAQVEQARAGLLPGQASHQMARSTWTAIGPISRMSGPPSSTLGPWPR